MLWMLIKVLLTNVLGVHCKLLLCSVSPWPLWMQSHVQWTWRVARDTAWCQLVKGDIILK